MLNTPSFNYALLLSNKTCHSKPRALDYLQHLLLFESLESSSHSKCSEYGTWPSLCSALIFFILGNLVIKTVKVFLIFPFHCIYCYKFNSLDISSLPLFLFSKQEANAPHDFVFIRKIWFTSQFGIKLIPYPKPAQYFYDTNI